MTGTTPILTRAQLAETFKDPRVLLAFDKLFQQVNQLSPGLSSVNFVVTAADTTDAPNAHVLTAGAGITVTGGSGSVTVALSGNVVNQFSAGTTGLTPSTSTSGVVTLGGTLAITNGGTGATTASAARTNLGVSASGNDTAYAWRSNNLSDLTNATTARTNLGLGTAAVQAIGTSGANVPLLSAANTWTLAQTFTVAPAFTDQPGTRTALGLSGAIPAYSAVSTDADFTFTRSASSGTLQHTGTLTANRTVTLSTTGAVAGDHQRFVRTGTGAFTLALGTLKTLATGTWADIAFDGTAWFLSGYGSL